MKSKKLRKLLGLMLAVTLILPSAQLTASAEPASGSWGRNSRQAEESAAVASQENREGGLVGFEGAYAISEVDTPVSVIVEFAHQPAKVVQAIAEANDEEVDASTKELKALAEKDKKDFYKALEGIEHTVKYEYSTGMNGVAVTVPQSFVDDIAQLECVFAVYPDETHANVIEQEEVYEEEERIPEAADQFPVVPAASDEPEQAEEKDVFQGDKSVTEDAGGTEDSVESDHEAADSDLLDEDADGSQDAGDELEADTDAEANGSEITGATDLTELDADAEIGEPDKKEDPADEAGNNVKEETDSNTAVAKEPVQTFAGARDASGYVHGMEESYNYLDIGSLGLTGKGVTVGVIDTGIDYNHPDLKDVFSSKLPNGEAPKSDELLNGRFVGRNYIKNNGNGVNDPMDDQGHGTHVSGTIAGRGVNSGNVKNKGVAPEATLAAYKVINSKDSCLEGDVNKAMEDAVKDGCKIISMSLGWNTVNNATHSTNIMLNSLALAYEDVLFVLCAGNSGSRSYTIWAPGTSPLALTVANAQIESENRLLTLNCGGKESPLRLIYSGWGDAVVDAGGKYTVGSLKADAKGNYKMVMLPNTDGNNLGTGTQEEFDAFFKNNNPEDYKGALFVVMRGQPFNDVVARIRAKTGTGAVAVINTESRDFSEISYWHTCYADYLPVFAAQYEEGRAMVDGLVLGQTYDFSFTDAKPLRKEGIDTESHPHVSTSVGPVKESFDFKPDITAPGTNIISTAWKGYISGDSYDYGYVAMTGTSMATPHISAIAALLRQKNPKLTALDIKAALVSTADRSVFPGAVSRLAVGSGMVDPARALQAIDDLVIITAPNAQAYTFNRNELVVNTVETTTISLDKIARGKTESKIQVTVRNKGKKNHTYSIGFENEAYVPDNRSSASTPLSGIFSTDKKSVAVAAGGEATFTLTAKVPADAAVGAYEATVVLSEGAQRLISPAAVYVYEDKVSDPITDNPVAAERTFIHTAALSTGENKQLSDYDWLGSDRTMLQYHITDETVESWQPLLYKDGQLVGTLDRSHPTERGWFLNWWEEAIVMSNCTPCTLEEDGTIVPTADTAPVTEEGLYKVALLLKKQGASHKVVDIADVYIDNTLPEIRLTHKDSQENWTGVADEGEVIFRGNIFDAGTKEMQDNGINSAVNQRVFGKTTSQSDNVVVIETGDQNYRAEIDQNGDFSVRLPAESAKGEATVYFGDHFLPQGIEEYGLPANFSEGFAPQDISYAQQIKSDQVAFMNWYGFRAANMNKFDVKLNQAATEEEATKTDLQNLINELKKKLEMTDIYTAESIERLDAVIKEAEALIADGEASLDELNAQIEALKNTDAGMELKPNVPDNPGPTDPSKPTDPTKPVNPADPTTPGSKPTQPGTGNPQKNAANNNGVNTGDSNPTVLCLVMILLSLAGMEGCVYYRYRRRRVRK